MNHSRLFTLPLLLASSAALAHGPQLQITATDGKIVTREILVNSYTPLTAEKSAYVMPVSYVDDLEFGPSWRATPTDDPHYPFGPGLAYGLGQVFAADSEFTVSFLDELKIWDGVAFASAGDTELAMLRTSNPDADALTDNVGVSGATDASVELSVDYSHGGEDAHGSITWVLLGDGVDPLSPLANGVYLATVQIDTTDPAVAPSDPFQLILNKGPTWELSAAVGALGLEASSVQYLAIPEPATAALAIVALAVGGLRRRG